MIKCKNCKQPIYKVPLIDKSVLWRHRYYAPRTVCLNVVPDETPMEEKMEDTQEDMMGFCSPREKAEYEWFHFKDVSKLGDLLVWLWRRFEYARLNAEAEDEWYTGYITTKRDGPSIQFAVGSVIVINPDDRIEMNTWDSFQRNYMRVE